MAYSAGDFMVDHKQSYFNSLRNIRARESAVRDVKARAMMEELKKQRILEGKPSPRKPLLICRRMEHLPNPGVY